ncbi:NAD(P)H-hydrate dehydratase [Altererythrobacter soli]|uniref:Bifunctional NAD(P)H-hydrate repair enzyme n=1 Tax=Croceibacterium soli TaxID=1739690 RepID=A0A6I4V089_9SPHN|nr:NAD(P)H-hydrate dehydratase [Croceibacterium soli]MXP42415.1 NAD(P)H-hydrate dehydratase [Croceibacterium soli]
MAQASEQVLTVAQMRAAEEALIAAGETIDSLMQRAGERAAEWIWRIAAGRPVTVLCGPGNNGGDGYVIAETLRRRGLLVTIVAPLEPRTGAARRARAAYGGEIAARGKGGVFVDCLFGSGLARPLGAELASMVGELARTHSYRIAIDLPSGVASDDGALLNEDIPRYDVTLALGAWKFAHWSMPAMAIMGQRRLVPIGLGEAGADARLLARPRFAAPAIDAHKYTRGLVTVVGGPISGASQLACEGAIRAGAGTVRLAADKLHPAASADIVLKDMALPEVLADERTGAVLVGPGLGLDERARARLRDVLHAGRPTVVDADALRLIDPAGLEAFSAPLVLTPHEGELAQLAKCFAIEPEGKFDRARTLARATGAVIIAKGPDTVIAAPDGHAVLAPSASSWLAVAGSGDVLAGIVASRLAATGDPLRAACEGHWLHGEAARRCGAMFTASELARAVGDAYAAAL